MKISIIIPIYNVEPYVEACVASVAKQSFRGEIECLLVDDCGRDKSIDVAKRFIESDASRVVFRILQYEQNKGAAGARNEGLKYATGDYVFFLDGDDILPDDALEKLALPLIKHPEADFSVGIIRPSRNDVGLNWMNTCLKDVPVIIKDSGLLKRMLLNRYTLYMTACNKLIKRSLFAYPGMTFLETVTHEDDHWNFYLAKYAKVACVVKSVTYDYIIHEESKSQTFNQEKYDADYLKICEDWVEHIDSVCQERQVQMVLSLLVPIWVFSEVNSYRKQAKDILIRLATYCNLGRRLFIQCICVLQPKWILRLRLYGLLTKVY